MGHFNPFFFTVNCVEFSPGSYVVNYGFIYALCGGQVCLGLLHGKC